MMLRQLDNRSKILFHIIVVSLFIACISFSYAYFSINFDGNGKSSVVTTGNMEITFEDGPVISKDNFLPGDSITKTFSVKNTGNVDTKYDVYFSELINSFVDLSDLVYTLSSENGCQTISEVVVPNSSGTKLVDKCLITPDVTHSYTLTLKFKETNDNQNDNAGKIFSTKLLVNEYKEANDYQELALNGAYPEIYDGMIPVTIDETGETKGTIRVANTKYDWYSYEKHEWANAVIAQESARNKEPGEIITQDEILQMYVWIPRYKYKLWNANNGYSNEQMIEVSFESETIPKSTGSTNGTWLTHPAFTFGDTELNGIWVGKFEPGYLDATSREEAQISSEDVTKLIIKPNVFSWRYMSILKSFNVTRKIESSPVFGLSSSQIDSHMMKNMEWGAVAYLAQSIYGRFINFNECIPFGCELWENPSNNYLTGYSGTFPVDTTTVGVAWNNLSFGGSSSTTGNLSGIYDLSGGAWEYVMGNVNTNKNTETYFLNDGENAPNLSEDEMKYVDVYTNIYGNNHYSSGHLGDATREVIKAETSWYGDHKIFPYSNIVWFGRGGTLSRVNCGLFNFGGDRAIAYNQASWRVVITRDKKHYK